MDNSQMRPYNVDICLCIDCTESMDNILNIVKARALGFYYDLQKNMNIKSKRIDKLRVRLVAFRDYMAYEHEKELGVHINEPMMITDFFTLPDDNSKLEICVNSLQPVGGGDDPEDGLEALAYAICSDWQTGSAKSRNIIVLWTDSQPHRLGYGISSTRYPKDMASNFTELTKLWGDEYERGCFDVNSSKRLVLYAPAGGAWEEISNTWDNVLFVPSVAGNGLREVDYNMILDCIINSI